MSFRVAVGGLCHETNQFLPTPTPLEAFDVDVGNDVLTGRMAAARTILGGLIAGAREFGAEPVGTLFAVAEPSGTITADAYRALKTQLLSRLEAAAPVDAVALELHGAGVVDGIDDLEGDLCEAVRELIGADVVLTVGHDLHGHISEREAKAVDALFSVHEYPHDDMYECGQKAVRAIAPILQGELRPSIHIERLPLVVPMTTTYHGVGRAAREVCDELARRSGASEVVFVHGFPYADHPLVGGHVVAVLDGSAAEAAALAREGAAAVWAMRNQFTVERLPPEEAIARALEMDGRPVVINEFSDNPGGGAPGDGTHLLAAMVEAGVTDAVFCGLVDPDAVRAAHEAGVGATLTFELGGKHDSRWGRPVACTGYVRSLTDGETVIEAATGRGWRYPLGFTALLMVDGLEVILFSRTVQTIDRTPLLLHGIDPLQRKLIALKSNHHFRSGFEDLAAAIVTTDPPGVTTHDVTSLSRQRCPRPIFPIDPEADYRPDGELRP
jgi:microcystin degradation protein MlrC